MQVENYLYATSQLAQTTLRSVLGQALLDELLSEREKLNLDLQKVIDEHTEPWGIKVSMVEVKQVDLPPEMQRAMAKQAEAEREKRAKIIHASGEFEAATAAVGGRRDHRPPAGDAAAAVPADADRDRQREELDDHLPAADRPDQDVPETGLGLSFPASFGTLNCRRARAADPLPDLLHRPAGGRRSSSPSLVSLALAFFFGLMTGSSGRGRAASAPVEIAAAAPRRRGRRSGRGDAARRDRDPDGRRPVRAARLPHRARRGRRGRHAASRRTDRPGDAPSLRGRDGRGVFAGRLGLATDRRRPGPRRRRTGSRRASSGSRSPRCRPTTRRGRCRAASPGAASSPRS